MIHVRCSCCFRYHLKKSLLFVCFFCWVTYFGQTHWRNFERKRQKIRNDAPDAHDDDDDDDGDDAEWKCELRGIATRKNIHTQKEDEEGCGTARAIIVAIKSLR